MRFLHIYKSNENLYFRESNLFNIKKKPQMNAEKGNNMEERISYENTMEYKNALAQGEGVPNKTFTGNTPLKEDEISSLTETDFINGEICKALYLVKDKIVQGKLEFLIFKRAKQVGGNDLVSLFKRQKKDYFSIMEENKKAQIKLGGTVNGMTNYLDLPKGLINLDCGYSWVVSDEGIYRIDTKLPQLVSKQPLLIGKIYKLRESGEERVELWFKKDGKWSSIICDKDILASAQKITVLHKFGISITSNNAKNIVAYLQDLEDYSREKHLIPIVETVTHLGWNENMTEFFPYTNKEIEIDLQGKCPGLLETLQEKGDKNLCYTTIKKVRGIPMVDFLIAANLSAPIIGMTKSDGFVANLYGPSRGGKTVSNKIAASIWGGIHNSDGFIYSADNTNNSVEGILGVYCNLPFIMEDANNMDARKQKNLQSLVMKLCNGVGRGRMKKDTSLRIVLKWYTSGIMTSERRITQEFKDTGAINRVLLLRGTNEEDCPFNKGNMDAGELLEIFEDNHGFIGRDFVQVLMEMGADKVKRMLKEVEKEVREQAEIKGKSGGQVRPVAIMLLADKIAEEYLFHDKKCIKMEDALQWMTDAQTADQSNRFYEFLMDTVIQNSGKFEDLGMTEDMNINQYWGRYLEDKQAVAILPAVLKKLADDNNVDLKLFLEFLDDKGLLIKDKEGNFKKNTNSRMLKKGVRMYVISMPEIDFVDSDEVGEKSPFD